MSEPADVRRLDSRDVAEWGDTLRELLLENAQINFPFAEDPAVMAGRWLANLARFVQDGSAVALGAFEDGSLKGLLWAHRREFAGCDRMHVGQLVVAAESRSRGLGQQLLDGVADIARDEGIGILELMMTTRNVSAHRFYTANGFVTTRVLMEKELPALRDGE